MKKDAKVYIIGYRGLVGSAIKRNLEAKGYSNLVYSDRSDFDLRKQAAVESFFQSEKPEYLFLAAAKVGGIWANKTYPAEFIHSNLSIQTNVIHAAYKYGVRKLLFLGSSCIYPKLAPQPIGEDSLLTSPLEPTNEAYAIAKIAGLKMCRYYNEQYGTDFISVMPTNLYGRGDNYDLENSHVLPAMIRKFHLAKALLNKDMDLIRRDLEKNPVDGLQQDSSFDEIVNRMRDFGIISDSDSIRVKLWGTGSPKREFLLVDDFADAAVYLMTKYSCREIGEIINIGIGEDVRIRDLAEKIKKAVGFTGDIEWDTTKPDGTPRKLLDVSRLSALGWQATTPLDEGIEQTYSHYLE